MVFGLQRLAPLVILSVYCPYAPTLLRGFLSRPTCPAEVRSTLGFGPGTERDQPAIQETPGSGAVVDPNPSNLDLGDPTPENWTI